MKPARLSLTHDLVINYGLGKRMVTNQPFIHSKQVFSPPKATKEQCQEFHSSGRFNISVCDARLY